MRIYGIIIESQYSSSGTALFSEYSRALVKYQDKYINNVSKKNNKSIVSMLKYAYCNIETLNNSIKEEKFKSVQRQKNILLFTLRKICIDIEIENCYL